MRKPSSKRGTVLPLGIKNKIKTELPALVALSAIGEPWFSEQHRCDLLAVALVVREMTEPESPQSQCAAELQRLCEGPVSLDSKVGIALNLAECLPWLQTQQNQAIRAVADRQMALAA